MFLPALGHHPFGLKWPNSVEYAQNHKNEVKNPRNETIWQKKISFWVKISEIFFLVVFGSQVWLDSGLIKGTGKFEMLCQRVTPYYPPPHLEVIRTHLNVRKRYCIDFAPTKRCLNCSNAVNMYSKVKDDSAEAFLTTCSHLVSCTCHIVGKYTMVA